MGWKSSRYIVLYSGAIWQGLYSPFLQLKKGHINGVGICTFVGVGVPWWGGVVVPARYIVPKISPFYIVGVG